MLGRLIVLFVLFLRFASAEPLSGTLQEQLEHAYGCFGQGDFGAANAAFVSLSKDFSGDPVFTDLQFQKALLPVRGMSALLCAEPGRALEDFEAVLTLEPLRPGLLAFALYQRAEALSQLGRSANAAAGYRAFRERFPATAEALLATLYEAREWYRSGAIAEADALVDAFAASEAPLSLRQKARLLALQEASARNDTGRAADLLLGACWDVDAMPDVAVLSFAAMRLGDQLLEAGRAADALRAYREAYPRRQLIELQRERVQQLHAIVNATGDQPGVWTRFQQTTLTKLEAQLAHLEASEDYTFSFLLRYGQACLLALRPREAAYLFRTLAQDTHHSDTERVQAHYRWILALLEQADWDGARTQSLRLIEAHPDHPLIPDTHYLIAQAYEKQGDPTRAIAVLRELLESYPSAPQRSRWWFSKGYNHCVLEDYASARRDYRRATDEQPTDPLVPNIRLWHALTWFFEKDYGRALAELDTLKALPEARGLLPEIQYRIAHIQYAAKDHRAALESVDNYLQRYRSHSRHAESCALKGDILMASGELESAIAAFDRVPADDPNLHDYATFQIVKILRAQEALAALRAHLERYLKHDAVATRPRMTEAYYWIAWSHRHEGESGAAIACYRDALQRFGNEASAGAAIGLIGGYAGLMQQIGKGREFEEWIRDETRASLDAGQLTWHARLVTYRANQLQQSGQPTTARKQLQSLHLLVPIAQQGAGTLAQVGLALCADGYSIADEYFERLLRRHSHSPHRAAAFYGKAKLAVKDGDTDSAWKWISRYLNETPTYTNAGAARLLAADILIADGRYDDAQRTLEDILQLKSMRGRPHAGALATLGKLEQARGNPKRAIPYYQRVTTLYRAHPDLVAEAYWQSALLFEAIGDEGACERTLAQMLSQPELEPYPQFEDAREKSARRHEPESEGTT